MQFIYTAQDPWHAAGGEDGPQPHPPVRAHSLLTLEQWHAVRETWPTDVPAGISLANTVDIEALAADLPRVGLVVLHFPKWVDGRAYTQARLLRARYRYAGQVRATGDVLVDMVPLLARTGFSQAQLRADQKLDAAQRALGFFAGHYQGDVLQPRPAFARDLAQEAGPAADRARAELHAGQGI
ncbi:MAG: DUF934 domain-containing protein [Aquabacterium sp.]|nr:DUF934 domain-containing protein [Aquabacterium sp.]